MLIKKVDLSIIQPLGNLLSDLVRTPPLNHVQRRPPVLCLSTGRSTHEQRVPELALQVVLFDMVCDGGGYFPIYY